MNTQSLTGPTTLSPDQQFQLESYKEQTASWRHLDNLLYRFTTIILPVSIAALGLSYVGTGGGGMATEMPTWLPMIGGLSLMTFWIISSEIIEIKTQVRFKIIHKMEEDLKITGHKEFAKKRKEGYRKYLRSHHLRRLMFGAYVAAVGMLIFYFGCFN